MLKSLWENVTQRELLTEAQTLDNILLTEVTNCAKALMRLTERQQQNGGNYYNDTSKEAVTANINFDVDLDKAVKMLDAAKRGLGLVGKMDPGPEKVYHSKRIMINMNKIRGLVQRLVKKGLEQHEEEELHTDVGTFTDPKDYEEYTSNRYSIRRAIEDKLAQQQMDRELGDDWESSVKDPNVTHMSGDYGNRKTTYGSDDTDDTAIVGPEAGNFGDDNLGSSYDDERRVDSATLDPEYYDPDLEDEDEEWNDEKFSGDTEDQYDKSDRMRGYDDAIAALDDSPEAAMMDYSDGYQPNADTMVGPMDDYDKSDPQLSRRYHDDMGDEDMMDMGTEVDSEDDSMGYDFDTDDFDTDEERFGTNDGVTAYGNDDGEYYDTENEENVGLLQRITNILTGKTKSDPLAEFLNQMSKSELHSFMKNISSNIETGKNKHQLKLLSDLTTRAGEIGKFSPEDLARMRSNDQLIGTNRRASDNVTEADLANQLVAKLGN